MRAFGKSVLSMANHRPNGKTRNNGLKRPGNGESEHQAAECGVMSRDDSPWGDPCNPRNLTSQLQRRWIIIFWLMLIVTVAMIAGMIYVTMQWEKDDRRQNQWLDQMCAAHGGT